MALIAQVALGHAAALTLPSMPELADDLHSDWPYFIFRGASGFGTQSAFLFIFMSGFMVAGPLISAARDNSFPSGRYFLSKRLYKLVPVAWVALVFTAALDLVGREIFGGEQHYRQNYAYDMVNTFDVASFVGNALFLQPILVDSFGSNGPLWTLGYIFQFYVIGWLVLRLGHANRYVGALSLLLVFVLMALVRLEWAITFGAWLLGGVARRCDTHRINGFRAFILAAVLLVAGNLFPVNVMALLTIPTGFALVACMRSLPGSFLSAFRFSLRRIGNGTYAVYAIHHPVLLFLFATLFTGTVGATWRLPVFVGFSVVCVLGASLLVLVCARRVEAVLRGGAAS